MTTARFPRRSIDAACKTGTFLLVCWVFVFVTARLSAQVSPANLSPSSGAFAPGQWVTFTMYGYSGDNWRLSNDYLILEVSPTASQPWNNVCNVQYQPATQTVYLTLDNGTSWASSPVGAGGRVLSNSQCSVDLSKATTSGGGTTGPGVTITLPVSFSSSYIGVKYLYVGTYFGNFSWYPFGSITVDNEPPSISATASPAANAAGWNNTNVTVTFSCSDKVSGVASCPAPQTITMEGANQVIKGTATDLAGNSASTSLTLNIDKTPPTITAAASPFPNSAGWNNSNVTVTFTCGDSLSGVASCPNPITVSADGANQVVAGTATDLAGNTATASMTVNLDKTPPTITASATPAANAAGWNNSNVTVTFTCTDSTSGVAQCPPTQIVSTDGSNQQIGGTAVDVAGNTATNSVIVNLDETPPNLTITSPPNGQTISLSTTSITVMGTESDTVSGVAGVTCNGAAAVVSGSKFACTISLTQGSNSISVQANDIAGNSTTSPLTLVFAPAPQVTITSPANLSVTNTTPVTVTGTVSDTSATLTINGIPVPQGSGSFSIPVPLVEGLNVLSAVATNTSGVAGTATSQITLDTTPPHVTIDSPADGTIMTDALVTVTGIANDVVVGTVNALDVQVTVNGIAAQVANRTYSAANVPLALGTNTIRAQAVDRAGNGTTTSVTVMRVLPSQPPAPPIGQAVITQSISVVSGNNQTGVIGAQLPAPLVVALLDPSSNPVPNQSVLFKVKGSDGTLSGTSLGASAAIAVNTDANGKAQVSWTLGQRSGAGINTVQASSPLAIGPVNFTATAVTGSPSQIVVDSGNGQTGVLGQALPFPFVAAIVDSGHNRVANVPVTFTVTQGGGNFGGGTSQIVNTDSNGRAIAVLALGLQEGFDNNVVEANFPGNTGFPAAFAASSKAPGNPANTTISGVVLDNSNNPIPGATIRLFQTNQGSSNNLPVQIGTPVQTTAQGTFLIPSAPVGSFKLMADGSTATNSVGYPTLEYDIVTVPGNDNTVGMPIYLPALDNVNKLCVGATSGGTLTLPQVPGFSLMVLPGSATFPGGSKQGCISVTPVNGDKVPMAPGFGQQPRFIVTIQPVGTIFNPPAPMTLPNVDALAPRSVTEMYSYDHDLGMFVAIGTGTVSDDGSVIRSNPGVGVLKAGWHCGGNPNTTGSAGTCPSCYTCQGSNCVVDPAQNGLRAASGSGCCNYGTVVPNKAPDYSSLLANCPKATEDPNSPLNPNSSDGCSSPLGNNPTDPLGQTCPDAAFGSVDQCNVPLPNCTINPPNPLACEKHDFCYRTCGSPKSVCDTSFLMNMQNICKNLPVPEFSCGNRCLNFATIYYLAVLTLGGPAFQKDQVAACECCP